MCMQLTNTSIKEYPEKYSWWLNELESLGLAVKKATDINDILEVSSLTDSIKQVMFQDYKTCYNEETEEGIVVWSSYTKYSSILSRLKLYF